MKKHITILLTIALLLVAVAGCSPAAQTEDTTDNTVAEDTVAEDNAEDESVTEDTKPADETDQAEDESGYDLTGCEPLVVVIPTAGGAQNIETKYTETWMELVTERTNGLVTFDYSNGGALGSYAELLDGVNVGAYDMTVTDLGQLNPYVPETVIPSMPFLMSSYDQLKEVYSSDVFTWLQDSVKEQTNMIPLNAYFCGFREILSKDKLEGLSDFDGYLIRSPQVDTFTSMFETLGFSYVTLSWADTYTGMQTGIIDSVETALMSLYNTGFYDLGKFVVLTNHMQAVNTLVVNEEFWNALPEVYREIMSDALSEIEQDEWDECIANEEYFKEQLEAEGVTVTEISASEREAINEAFMSYWQEKADEIGGEAPEMLAEIISMGN